MQEMSEHHARPKGHPHAHAGVVMIIGIQFEPNGEIARFLHEGTVDIGTRFVVPGAKDDDAPRMGTAVSAEKREHKEMLPSVLRPLAPGETWRG